MTEQTSAQDLFKGRHFDQEISVLCIRWYLTLSQLPRSRPNDGRARHRLGPYDHFAVGAAYVPEFESAGAVMRARLWPKALGRCCASRLAERRKSIVAPVESTARYKYPLALDPDVGLIHLPAVVGQSEPRSQSALNFWGVTLDPPPDDDVVDQKSALGKEFLNVTVGQ